MSEKLGTVLVPGRINPRVPEQLAQVFEVVTVSQAPSADIDPAVLARIRGVALSGKFANEWFDLLPNLQVIANFGVGYDGVDTAKAAERGIVVTNTPDVLNDEVADTAIALLLNTVRRLPQAETWLREGRWKSEGPFPLVPLRRAAISASSSTLVPRPTLMKTPSGPRAEKISALKILCVSAVPGRTEISVSTSSAIAFNEA